MTKQEINHETDAEFNLNAKPTRKVSRLFCVLFCVSLAVIALAIVGVWVYQNVDFSLPDESIVQRERTERQMEHPELLIEDLVLAEQGERQAEQGDTIVVHYVGMFEDGSVFDSSVEKNRPFVFKVGSGNVIKGWNIGVEGMRKGDKRKLTIPPELAYGKGGVRGLIEPDTTVVFEIELLEIR